MRCPDCSKEIPSDSKFCLHCGAKTPINTDDGEVKTSQHTPTKYEYFDYVFEINSSGTWGKLHNDNDIAHSYWNSHQTNILTEILELEDEGWEPVSEIGPAGIKMREEPPGCLTLLFEPSSAELQRRIVVTKFTAKLRRKVTTENWQS